MPAMSFQIVPGEQFVYDKNNRVMDVRMVDTESYVSWKDGITNSGKRHWKRLWRRCLSGMD